MSQGLLSARVGVRIRSRSTVASLAALAISLYACGGAQPPPRSEPAAASATGLAVASSPPETTRPDLSPAAEPEYLVALGRWRSPKSSFDVASKWTGLSITPALLFKMLGEPGLASLLADDAPVDAVVALDPKGPDIEPAPLAAFSVGVRSLADALQTAERKQRVTETAPGVFRIGTLKHPSTDSMTCYLASSVGSAPARIVCGDTERDVSALLPYLTRTLPIRDLGPADLHAELRFQPMQKLFGQELAIVLRSGAAVAPSRLEIGEVTFDRALGRAASGLAEELTALANDLDTLSLDVTLGAAETEIAAQIKLKSHQSWTAETVASLDGAQAPAPDAFWRLPQGSTSASFAHPSDAKRYTEMIAVVRDLLDGWLTHEGIPAADRARATALLAPSRMVAASAVSAAGPNGSDPKTAAAVPKDHPLGQTWNVWGISETDRTMLELRDAVAVVNLPKIKALIERKVQKSLEIAVLSVRAGAPPAGLPKGTLDVEITVVKEASAREGGGLGGEELRAKAKAGAKAAKRGPRYTAHFIAMPDGGRTWIALGVDRETLKRVLLSIKDVRAGTGTLATRSGLERLRTERLVGGGYFTIKGLADQLPKELDAAAELAQAARLIETAPNRGMTPITLTVAVSANGPLTLTGSVRVPKSAIEDLTVIATGMAMRRGRP